MDAQTMFRMMKPHLEVMDQSQKKMLSSLISALPAEKICGHHKKVLSVQRAKENLKEVCRREMIREKKPGTSS